MFAVEVSNVAVVRNLFDAWARMDPGWQSAWDSQCVWQAAIEGVVEGGDGTYRGVAGFLEYVRERNRVWSEVAVKLDQFQDLGERVLVLGRVSTKARGSGIPFDQAVAWLFRLSDGKVIEGRVFLDPTEAVALVKTLTSATDPAPAVRARRTGH